MKVAFDATTLQPYKTGVGYYTEHLLRHLVGLDAGHEFVLLSNRAIVWSHPTPTALPVYTRHRFPIRTVWMQTLLPLALRDIRPNLAHFTNSIVPLLTDVPRVVTIHDMTLSLFPHLHPWRKQILTRPLVALAARVADAIITVSESARRDIVRLLKVPESKVHVIYEAPAPAFRPIREQRRLEEVRRRYGLAQRFILYVGTIEPRKNLPRLIEAFARLCRNNGIPHQLVLVGAHGWGYEAVFQRIESLGLRDRVRFLGYIPFEDLAPLYNLSEVFLFPSLYEGFGLPVIEAMACGTPVITSANSSFGEIAGGAVVTVDPCDVDAIAQSLKHLLDDPDLRRAVGERGLTRARRFSWQRAAERTLEVYQRVVERTVN